MLYCGQKFMFTVLFCGTLHIMLHYKKLLQLACIDVFVKALISTWFDILLKDNAKQMLFVPPIHTAHAHMFTRMYDA